MDVTGLSREDAQRAKLREFNESFLLDGAPKLIEEVCCQIVHGTSAGREAGTSFTYPERTTNDKGRVADILQRCYQYQWWVTVCQRILEQYASAIA